MKRNKSILNNFMPYIIFGGISFILWYRNKKESELSGIPNPNNFSFGINKEKVLDTAIRILPINPIKKEMLFTIKNGFINGFKKGFTKNG